MGTGSQAHDPGAFRVRSTRGKANRVDVLDPVRPALAPVVIAEPAAGRSVRDHAMRRFHPPEPEQPPVSTVRSAWVSGAMSARPVCTLGGPVGKLEPTEVNANRFALVEGDRGGAGGMISSRV